MIYLLVVEGFVRQVAGARWILGNHVVVATDDGDHAVLAHLRRGSVAGRTGDVMRRRQKLGEAGNSGASSEPHLHIHAQTRGTAAAPLSGRPVPILLAGRRPLRNSRF